jgi:hypothetical protein
MRKLIIIAIILLCGVTAFSQGIYTPANPTAYGLHVNRLKPDSAQHVPEKDSTTTNTADTTAQIFYNRADSSFWGWSLAKGFFQIGSGTPAVTPTWEETLIAGSVLNQNNTVSSPTGRRFAWTTTSPSTGKYIQLFLDTAQYTIFAEGSTINSDFAVAPNSIVSQTTNPVNGNGTQIQTGDGQVSMTATEGSPGGFNRVKLQSNSSVGVVFETENGEYSFPRTVPITGQILKAGVSGIEWANEASGVSYSQLDSVADRIDSTNNAVVFKAGNQTITGIKTFSTGIIANEVSIPTTGNIFIQGAAGIKFDNTGSETTLKARTAGLARNAFLPSISGTLANAVRFNGTDYTSNDSGIISMVVPIPAAYDTLQGDTSLVTNAQLDTAIRNAGIIQGLKRWKGLIGQQTGSNSTGGISLRVGQIYTVSTFVAGDDFSNMTLISGTVNTTGSVFQATSDTPTGWANGSDLVWGSEPYAIVLENSMGEDLTFNYINPGEYEIISGNGYFTPYKTLATVAGNRYDPSGPIYWNFAINTDLGGGASSLYLFSSSMSIGGTLTDEGLLFTPVEITVYP